MIFLVQFGDNHVITFSYFVNVISPCSAAKQKWARIYGRKIGTTLR